MDQHLYKQQSESKNAFSRNVLEETVRAIRPVNVGIADKIQSLLDSGPVQKPQKHKGGPETDFFMVELDQSEIEVIVEVFANLEVTNISPDGRTTSEASHYASLLDAWYAAT